MPACVQRWKIRQAVPLKLGGCVREPEMSLLAFGKQTPTRGAFFKVAVSTKNMQERLSAETDALLQTCMQSSSGRSLVRLRASCVSVARGRTVDYSRFAI